MSSIFGRRSVDGCIAGLGTRSGLFEKVQGSELEGIKCIHPLFQRESPLVMSAEFVTLEQGTGLVHIAPGHGLEDYEIGVNYGVGDLESYR